jgi:hypothetical protein
MGGPCRVFISSRFFNGDLREGGQGSGVAGADAKCQARAQAAGLTGTYRAWISDATSSPSTRFTNTANTGPYVLLDADATVIAANWAELTSGTLRAPIDVTESGAPLRRTSPWTHTQPNGTPGGPGNVHCKGWTSADPLDIGDIGTNMAADFSWSSWSTALCPAFWTLYCFEQG